MAEIRKTASLRALRATVANSPIIVPATPARDFADWCERQKPADIDAVILAWLRAQAAMRPRTSLS